MKKFLIFTFCFIIISTIKISGYSTTGYDDYSSIIFKEEGKLLIDMTDSEIKDAYKSLGNAKFWGWKHYYMNIKDEAVYIGETIFAKSNRSSQKVVVDYNLEEKTYAERKMRTTGSLSSKFEGTIKKIDASIEAEIEHESSTVDSIARNEKTSFSIELRPNRRIVFRVTGDVLVTNGVSKYYILGICFDKGSWEYVDVVTRYYELYEEEINE